MLASAKLSAEEHQRLLKFIEVLAEKDPPIDSPEGTALLTLALIVEEHESVHFPIGETPPPAIASKPDAFMQAIASDMNRIGDMLTAALPEGACFCLFVTDGKGGPGQAATVANVSRDAVVLLVQSWVEALTKGATHVLEEQLPSKH